MRNMSIFIILLSFFAQGNTQIVVNKTSCNSIKTDLMHRESNHIECFLEISVGKDIWRALTRKKSNSPQFNFEHLNEGEYRLTYILRTEEQGQSKVFNEKQTGQTNTLESSSIVLSKYFSISCDKKEKSSQEYGNKYIISAYPNPTQGLLNLQVRKPNEKQEFTSLYYEIYDTDSKLLKKGMISSSVYELDVTNISEGVYLISIRDILDKSIISTTRFAIIK